MATQTPEQQGKWPPSLEAYVSRSFERAGPKLKEQASIILREYIGVVNQYNALWTTDWNSVVIPELEKLLEKPAAPVQKSQTTSQQRKRAFMEDMSPATKSKAAKTGLVSKRNVFERTSRPNTVSQWRETEDAFSTEDSWDKQAVIGTSNVLEKRYLRLTQAPDPSTVRPLHVLKQTLELLKRKWKTEHDYNYICDQLKSVRQDLTVQIVRNEFTVEVYEVHARIALEKHDLGEYNQCQTQLAQLYDRGITGHRLEFMAYKILYFLHTKNRTGIYKLLQELTDEEKRDPAIQHALAVRKALAFFDYHALFKLFRQTVNMNAYMMDNFVERERISALKTMSRAYRPTLEVEFIAQELGFKNDKSFRKFLNTLLASQLDGAEAEAAEHDMSLSRHLYTDDTCHMLDCKQAFPVFVALSQRYEKVDIKGQI